MNELDSAADRFAVGELFPEDLSMAAAEALAHGHDTPALVELACLHRTDTSQAPALFRTAVAELGLVEDTEAAWSAREVDVRWRRVEKSASALLAGEGTFVEHLSRIASDRDYLSVTPEAGSPDLADLAADFDGFCWHLDDDTIDQDLLRDDLYASCRTLSTGRPWGQPVVTASTSARSRWWRALRRLSAAR